MKWIKDDEMIRGAIPMTKFPIRVLTLVKLGVSAGDRLLDIGGGTGSVSVQAALLGASVTVIERKSEGVDLIRENAEKFGVPMMILEGEAPTGLPDQLFTHCFIGGSAGRMSEILEWLETHLESGGMVGANFIVPDNYFEFRQSLKDHGYRNVEVSLIQTSELNNLGMLKGDNPIFIVTGVKK